MSLTAYGKGHAPDSNSDAHSMSQLGAVQVEISVLLGRSKLPIHQFLRMGRGAVIPLDAAEHDEEVAHRRRRVVPAKGAAPARRTVS